MSDASYAPAVATDQTDSNPHPSTLVEVHGNGIPHRQVHLEIVNRQGKYLVWKKRDGRWEIPAGHVDWLEPRKRAETYEEAALREAAEELGLLPKDYAEDQLKEAEELLRREADPCPVVRTVNQLPSSHGRNNEWVVVYRFTVSKELYVKLERMREQGLLGADEGKEATWKSEAEIPALALAADPDQQPPIGTSLYLFLRRRGALIPLRNDFLSSKPTADDFGGYEWVICRKRDKKGVQRLLTPPE